MANQNVVENVDPFVPIETPRLVLRCVERRDAAAISCLMTPAVSRWLASWPLPYTASMAVARIHAVRVSAFNGDALPFAVVEKADGVFVGWVSIIREPEDHGRGAFGYWLGEPYQNHGYMREIAPSALAAGFKLLNLNVIEAGAQRENRASLAVMRACGMELAGERMVYAKSRDRQELCQFYEVKRPK